MEPLVRSAALTGYPELCRALGADPAALLRRAGVDPHLLADQDHWMPAAAAARLLELAADACGREDFGLRLTERRRLANLGPVSLLVREEPDVRSVLRLLIRYQRMYNEALRAALHEDGSTATLHIALDIPAVRQLRQATELVVGAYHQILAGFLVRRPRPYRVCFTHPAPADPTTHLRLFGTAPVFGAGFDGIVLPTAALEVPNSRADPVLRRYAEEYVGLLAHGEDPSAPERVRRIIEILLPTGRCSADQVARSLGVDRRTVHRRLEGSGETFSSVLDATRVDLARRFVADGNLPLTEAARLLGFASSGALSRWFRARFGTSPTRWRGDPDLRAAAPDG
ncbi:AraC family transcriptional regulator [Streptomyces mangrovisoli]|uniref:AraC family transcriptional regulator n=1 Tax=Streptomyces mangrovisoli TaxID=1428628 RepID=A0A1J4NUB7_9ACTN|nr:AraC family transcriptional regulator [Streptomyces mangrovisoli]OIJ65108.1 AraC family transcriptional regulator [Streptomyces mangrovisoli]